MDIIDILWNIFLFILIFPYLISLKKTLLFKVVVYLIILSHILIVYNKLVFKHTIKWPIWTEIIAILFGILFIHEGYDNNNILIIMGFIIIYGHTKKIIYPNKPYYFKS